MTQFDRLLLLSELTIFLGLNRRIPRFLDQEAACLNRSIPTTNKIYYLVRQTSRTVQIDHTMAVRPCSDNGNKFSFPHSSIQISVLTNLAGNGWNEN